MDFRQARPALLALFVLIIAGCAQMPMPGLPGTSSAQRQGSFPQAPPQVDTAVQRLSGMAEPERTDTALAWAQDYLSGDQPQQAAALLDRFGSGVSSNDQRYRWLQLTAQTAMAQHQPDQALALLKQHQQDIQGLSAQQRTHIRLLHADALALDGQLPESLRERVAIGPKLNSDDQQYNRKLIWQTLLDLPRGSLEKQAEQSHGDLQGWLQLALLYRDPMANIDTQLERLRQWQQQWPDHPAAQRLPDMMQALRQAASHRPRHVAVLLPESGSLASAAQALRDGMMTAYYSVQQAGNRTPELRFYDSSQGDIQTLYQQALDDGADFVIGPLAKDKVAQLANPGSSVPTLALNYLRQNSRQASIFQFGLAPEDEARQVARHTLDQGNRYAGVLYPDTAWGQRVSQAFIMAFRKGGGRISAEGAYRNDDIGSTVKQFMDEVRRQQTRAGLPGRRGTEYQPHLGEDTSFVFLVADPNQGRQVKPALNFRYARHLPVYSTSYIYDGTPAPRRDRDLDNIRYLDMPWVLHPDSKLHQMAKQTWPDGHGRYIRLFAMGVDAYRLQARLSLLRNLPGSSLPGVTGRLHLDGHRVVRHSDWAVFRDGKATPLTGITETARHALQ